MKMYCRLNAALLALVMAAGISSPAAFAAELKDGDQAAQEIVVSGDQEQDAENDADTEAPGDAEGQEYDTDEDEDDDGLISPAPDQENDGEEDNDSDEDPVSETWYTKDGVNMRSGAGTDYDIVVKLPCAGIAVTVTDKSDSRWYGASYVNADGQRFEGYIAASCLTSVKPTAPRGTGMYVAADTALRTATGKDSTIIVSMKKGEKVIVLSTSNRTWYKVCYSAADGSVLTGYAAAGNISTEKPGEYTVYYTTSQVNMRKGPGTDYSIVLTLSKGADLHVTDTSGKVWYRASYTNAKGATVSGYVSAAYLSKTKPAETVTYYTTTAVKLRTGAGTKYKVLLTLNKGAKLEVTSRANKDWYKGTYTNSKGQKFEGYVAAKYLSKTRPDDGKKVTAVTYKCTSNVYMRAGQGTDYKALLLLPKGTKISVTDTSNKDWYKASYTNSKGATFTGYVNSQYLVKA